VDGSSPAGDGDGDGAGAGVVKAARVEATALVADDATNEALPAIPRSRVRATAGGILRAA
jgi:hypothetical protein